MSTNQLASRLSRLEASPIREILSLASKPNMISFAGGLPAQESFPELSHLISDRGDLQYGPSEGEYYLRKTIADNLQKLGIPTNVERVLIVSGSQQGIDLVAKLLIELDTPVAVESPTYLAALQVFKLFGARLTNYDVDSLNSLRVEPSLKLLYANPTFQNPSSRVYTKAERQNLAALCDERKTILFEDDPYRDLVYEAADRQPICSMVKSASWIYQSTFSKTIAPGLRVGYLTCSEDLFPYLLRLKQAADLHSCRVSQRYVHQLLEDKNATQRIVALQQSYKQKRDYFNSQLIRYFSDIARWTVPAGGLFFWLELSSKVCIDTREVLKRAVEEGVLFMPGEPFYADGREAANCFRLNFSNAKKQDVEIGLNKLAVLFREQLNC